MVEDELGLEVVCHLVVASEDLDVTVVSECRVGLDHVFLNDGRTGHRVVQHVEVLVDGFGGDFLAQTLLERAVGEVEADDDRPADIVPHLLHRSVVDEVQVIAFHKDTGGADFVGCQLALAERDTATVAALGVVRGNTAVHRDLLTFLHELDFSRGLLKTLAQEDGVHCLGVFGKLCLHCLQEELLGPFDFCCFCHVQASLGMKPYLVLSRWMRCDVFNVFWVVTESRAHDRVVHRGVCLEPLCVLWLADLDFCVKGYADLVLDVLDRCLSSCP